MTFYTVKQRTPFHTVRIYKLQCVDSAISLTTNATKWCKMRATVQNGDGGDDDHDAIASQTIIMLLQQL